MKSVTFLRTEKMADMKHCFYFMTETLFLFHEWNIVSILGLKHCFYFMSETLFLFHECNFVYLSFGNNVSTKKKIQQVWGGEEGGGSEETGQEEGTRDEDEDEDVSHVSRWLLGKCATGSESTFCLMRRLWLWAPDAEKVLWLLMPPPPSPPSMILEMLRRGKKHLFLECPFQRQFHVLTHLPFYPSVSFKEEEE